MHECDGIGHRLLVEELHKPIALVLATVLIKRDVDPRERARLEEEKVKDSSQALHTENSVNTGRLTGVLQ